MAEESSEKRLERLSNIEEAGKLLIKLARENLIGPIYERKEFVDKCLKLISEKNNLIIVGEHGVGKNAIIESLALRIVKLKSNNEGNNLPDEILEINTTKIMEGCIYIGNLENKVQNLVKNCVDKNVGIFFDNLHLGIGVWSYKESPQNDILNILNNSLLPNIRFISTTTPEGYKILQKTHPQFINNMIKIEIPPTSPESTQAILFELKSDLENKNNIKIENDVLIEVVRLSNIFIHWENFPGKAFKILSRLISLRKDSIITKELLYEYFMDSTGLPEFIIKNDLPLKKEDIKKYFEGIVFGQNEAIDEITNTILKFRTQLIRKSKPIASFLFVGTSGVGKTELAKALSKFLFNSEKKVFIYPMAQYVDQNGYRKLFGTLGGDIYELVSGEGKLINDVRSTPFSVILLDEIDQADKNVINALYQILDEGRFIENNGDVVSFKSTITIMTTNLGMDKFFSKNIGFKSNNKNNADNSIEDIKRAIIQDLENIFKSPFLGRIDKIIIFKTLNKEILSRIINKTINKLTEELYGLKERNIKIDLDENIIDLLIDKGYNLKYGARNIEKVVDNYIITPLANILSENPNLKDKVFHFTIQNREIKYSY